MATSPMFDTLVAQLPDVDPIWHLQVQRAHNMANDPAYPTLPANNPPTAIRSLASAVYPDWDQYSLGYIPGARIVVLPTHLADPPAIREQYAHSSAHTYSMFTMQDLPDILFRIEPHIDHFRNKNEDVIVPILCDATTNQPVRTNRGAILRYFSFLPRYIASDVSGALLEFWFRLDYRLEMNDILMRIETTPTGIVSKNTLNMRRVRFRNNINAPSWGDCRTYPPQNDLDLVSNLSPLQIHLNTTMLVDPVRGRLLKPVFSDIRCPPSSRIGYIDTPLPHHDFLRNRIGAIPTRRMFGILMLMSRVRALAFTLGHGTALDNYKYLSVDDAPPWWNDRGKGKCRAQGRAINEIDGLTHAQFMYTQIGPDMETGIVKRAKTRGWQV